MASGVIYYISDTLAEIVYVVEPMELILIKTKGEIHKKTIWNCYAQHLPLPSSMHLHVHELKVLLSFQKITGLCTCSVPWIFVCDQCEQYLPCVCT